MLDTLESRSEIADILKCGVGEGWRRSVELILCAMTKYYSETRKRGVTYK